MKKSTITALIIMALSLLPIEAEAFSSVRVNFPGGILLGYGCHETYGINRIGERELGSASVWCAVFQLRQAQRSCILIEKECYRRLPVLPRPDLDRPDFGITTRIGVAPELINGQGINPGRSAPPIYISPNCRFAALNVGHSAFPGDEPELGTTAVIDCL